MSADAAHAIVARGRPRSFGMEPVLEGAMEAFWRHGYHSTSIDVLVAATRITKGSLYKAFKDKKSLFLAAFAHYVSQGVAGRYETRLAEGEAPLDLIGGLLCHYARVSSADAGTKGCLVTATAMEMLPHDPEITQAVVAAMDRIRLFVERAVVLAQAQGTLPRELDASDASMFLLTLVQGMRVVGKTGVQEGQLRHVVAFAMRGLGHAAPIKSRE